MDTKFETANDTKVKTGNGCVGSDCSNELASEDGVDLNAGDTGMRKSLSDAPSAAGRIWGAFVGGIENPHDWARVIGTWRGVPGAEDACARLLQGALNAGVQYSAEHAQILVDQFSANDGSGLPMMEIVQAYNDGIESAGRTELVDPFIDSRDVYCGDTGINLTDPRLEGYGDLDEVPSEVLDEILGDKTVDNDYNTKDCVNGNSDNEQHDEDAKMSEYSPEVKEAAFNNTGDLDEESIVLEGVSTTDTEQLTEEPEQLIEEPETSETDTFIDDTTLS